LHESVGQKSRHWKSQSHALEQASRVPCANTASGAVSSPTEIIAAKATAIIRMVMSQPLDQRHGQCDDPSMEPVQSQGPVAVGHGAANNAINRRGYAEETKRVMEAVAAEIIRLAEGRAASGNVVPLRG
jgi:hypothetical protein